MKKYIVFLLLISFIYARRDCFQHADIDALGRSIRPDKHTYAPSPSGHFYIHYDTTGNASPDLEDLDDNGVPDYVDEVGIIADSTYHVLVNVMGYTEEPFDGEGGYDIYITFYSSPYVYGYNYSIGGGVSYLKIDNDYGPQSAKSNFDLTPIQIMQLSVAHEYFHGIQWGYELNLGNNAYFYEMTSMWFEDVLIPNGNDYLEDGWIDDLLDNPTSDFDNTGNGYELALFGHYLSSFIDPYGAVDEKNSTIIREIWEDYSAHCINTDNQCSDYINLDQCETSENCDWVRGNCTINTDTCVNYYNEDSCEGDCEWIEGENLVFTSVKSTLEDKYNQSFIANWTDFISRNLFNGIYQDMNNPFYYYIDQKLIRPIETNAQILESGSIVLSLDNQSTYILSYEFEDQISMFDIKHAHDDHVGKIAVIADNLIANNLYTGKDTVLSQIYTNDEIHLIYSTESSNSNLIIDLNVYTQPLPPLELKAKNILSSYSSEKDSIELVWLKPLVSENLLYYLIYRKDEIIEDSSFEIIDSSFTIGLDTLNYIDDGITGSSNYTYYVTCSNNIGESSPSNSITVFSWPVNEDVVNNQILSIYPNPINKSHNFEILYAMDSNYSNAILELINIRGEVVSRISLQPNNRGWHQQNINNLLTSNLSAGVYFVRLQYMNQIADVSKITILP